MEAVEARRIAELQRMSGSATGLVRAEKDILKNHSKALLDQESLPENLKDLCVDHKDILESLLTKIGDSKKTKSKELLAAAGSWIQDLDVPEDKAVLFDMLESLPEHIIKYSNAVLKIMYDHDTVNEKDIFKWHAASDPDNIAVANAQAFVDFLKD